MTLLGSNFVKSSRDDTARLFAEYRERKIEEEG